MDKKVFSFGTAALLSFGLFTSQALAQDFCSATGHTGQGVTVSNSGSNPVGDYHYELWYDYATNGYAVFYPDGSMDCSMDGAGDYLCRIGLKFNNGETYKDLSGDIIAEYKLVKKNISGVDYSYVGVYGWMKNVPGAPNGLVEYYVVDNTLSQWMPSDWVGNEKLAEGITIDGGTYNVYRNTRNGPAIETNQNVDFYQYFSIRSSMSDCGTINVSAHMRAWEQLGMAMGNLYEAKVLGEAGCNKPQGGTCGVSGSVDFPHAKVYISGGSSAPTSSASINPTSSSASSPVVASGTLPGTLEFENYESKHSDSLKVYGEVIGNIQPGDWVEWTVDVSYTGTYTFDILAARGDNQGRESTISLSMDDGTSVGSVSVLTNGWDDYDTFSGVTSSISAGQHKLRVTFTGGYVNVDNIQFTANDVNMSSKYEPPSSSSSPVNGSSASINPNPTSSNSVNNGSSASVGPNPTSSNPVNNESSASVGPTPTNNTSTNDSGSSNGGDVVDNNGQDVTAIGDIRLPISSGDMLVFDVQGRNMGLIYVPAGMSLEETLFARFHRSGIYLVKQGARMMKVRVSR